MTISATSSTLSTIDEIILQAYKRSGLLPIEFSIGADVQWNARAEHGRQTLNRLVNGLEEVETTGETPVKPISRHRWNSLSSKQAESTPTLYYLHRNGPDLTVY